jgi:PAS domain S-box-containing protein
VEPDKKPVCPHDALREAEEALRSSQRRFAAFMENLPGVAFMKDQAGRYLYVSRKLAEVFGCRPEDILGRTAFDLVPESLAREMQQGDQAVLAEGKPVEFLHTLPRPWGGQRWLSVRFPIEEAAGEPPILGGVGLDVTRYKQAEDALRESEEKYRLLVESADESIFTMDADGRYLFMNGNAAAMIGGKPSDFVGKTMWDVLPKELADDHVRDVRQVISSGLGCVREMALAVLDRTRWCRTSINPVRDSAGKVVSALVIARDISERKEAELALRKSEERFRLTFENAVDAIFWADPATGTIINCNKAAEALLQRPRKEIIGKHQTFIHPPEKASYYQGRFARDVREGKLASGDGEVVTGSGKIVPVHMAASLTTVGTEPILQGVFRDLSDLNQAWEAVRISQQRLAMVVSNAPVVLLLADRDGVIQFADGRALASLGLTGEQLAGQNILNVCHDAQAIGQSLRSALGGQDSASICEVSGRIFNVRLTPLRDGKGEITGVVGVAVDITARRKAEAALDAARLKLLRVREEEQKRLARDLHDSIGQQLVAMKMAFASAGLTDQAHKCAELIHETRRLCYNLYPPSLETLGLASALKQLGRHCEQAVCLDVRCPPEIESARFDPEKEITLFRIAQEAVNNALRHGKARTVQLSLVCRDGHLEMTVADDGCGFDPGAQAGKGLGLQTMTDRARAVGGAIGIDSRPGRTTIEVRVPLDSAAGGAPETL